MTTTIPTPEPSTDRDAQGRFTTGDRGGPGNPFARQVALLRQVLLQCVTADDMTAIAHKLIELAKVGNVQAIKLLFSYTLGKPAEAVQPDQLDIEEWELHKQTAAMMLELPQVVAAPEPSLPLAIARAARPVVAQEVTQQLRTTLEPPAADRDDRQARRERRWARRRQRRAARDNNGATTRPARPEDPRVRSALQASANRDQQALGSLSLPPTEMASADQPKPTLVPPSTNGENRARHRQDVPGADRDWEAARDANHPPADGHGSNR
jgi:hypothetical protein